MKKLYQVTQTVRILSCFFPLFLNISTFAGAAEKAEIFQNISEVTEAAFLKDVTKRLGEVKTLRADFTQQRYISLFFDTLDSKGLFYFEKPGKLRWELKKPYASLLIFNKNRVAKFKEEKGKLKKMNLGMEDILKEVFGQIISIMEGDFLNIRKIYNISVKKGDHHYKLILSPINKELAKVITSLELFVEIRSMLISSIKIVEPQRDYIEIKFFNSRENIPLPNELFNLDAPYKPFLSDNGTK